MAEWLERIKCSANIKGQYNQPVSRQCPLEPGFIRWDGNEFKVSGLRCRECGAIFKPGKERQYKPVTFRPQVPRDSTG